MPKKKWHLQIHLDQFSEEEEYLDLITFLTYLKFIVFGYVKTLKRICCPNAKYDNTMNWYCKEYKRELV